MFPENDFSVVEVNEDNRADMPVKLYDLLKNESQCQGI